MSRIFVHRQGSDVSFADADPGLKVADLGERVGPGARVWIEDEQEPLDPALTLDEAGVSDGSIVHVSLCESVTVDVRYQSEHRRYRVSPAATGGSVLDLVAGAGGGGFGLTDEQRAMHVLALRDGGEEREIRRGDHIGTFTNEECIDIPVDLRPEARFAG